MECWKARKFVCYRNRGGWERGGGNSLRRRIIRSDDRLDIELRYAIPTQPVLQLGSRSGHNVLGATLRPVFLGNGDAHLEARQPFKQRHLCEHDQCRHRAAVEANIGESGRAGRLIQMNEQCRVNDAGLQRDALGFQNFLKGGQGRERISHLHHDVLPWTRLRAPIIARKLERPLAGHFVFLPGHIGVQEPVIEQAQKLPSMLRVVDKLLAVTRAGHLNR
jgi:hypothetical protein